MATIKTFPKTQSGMAEARAFYAACQGDASLTVGTKDDVITVTYTTKQNAVVVAQANKGAEVFGIQDGQALTIEKETDNFIFCTAPKNGPIKISKATKKACNWRNKATSPVFKI